MFVSSTGSKFGCPRMKKCTLFRRRESGLHMEIHLLHFFLPSVLPSYIPPVTTFITIFTSSYFVSSFFDMSLSVWPKIFLNTLFSSTLGLRSYKEVRDIASHPPPQKGKIILLYILIFIFLASILEDDTFCTE